MPFIRLIGTEDVFSASRFIHGIYTITDLWTSICRQVTITTPDGIIRCSTCMMAITFFYKHLAFGHHPWHADQMLDRLINHGLIEPIILVGVFNTPGRVYEYTWTAMPKKRGHSEGGGGHYYAHFLVDELKPRIDREFRTLKGPEHTGTMGSSLGGLISWYLGLYFPFVFQKVGLISPSLWWGRGHALSEMHKLSTEMQIWLDTGTREGQLSRGGNA
jgi:pimeloyl-ACP methyl ester carboxylesterase